MIPTQYPHQKTEWQLQREREERDFRLTKRWILAAMLAIAILIQTCATSPDIADFIAALWR
jgi:hypothetical protein